MREALGQDHRYAHVVRVARLADRLAARHGVDPRRARTAGMLHDLARLYPAARLLEECERRGLPVDDFERRNPIVLHARVGAELARERFGVDDAGVLSAICRHTVAAADMSPLDAIVYLADGLEPGRRFAERERLERAAFADLDAAMAGLLEATIAYMAARDLEVAPQTRAAYAAYRLERRPLPA